MLQSDQFWRLTNTSVRRRTTWPSNVDGWPYAGGGMGRPICCAVGGISSGAPPARAATPVLANAVPAINAPLRRKLRLLSVSMVVPLTLGRWFDGATGRNYSIRLETIERWRGTPGGEGAARGAINVTCCCLAGLEREVHAHGVAPAHLRGELARDLHLEAVVVGLDLQLTGVHARHVAVERLLHGLPRRGRLDYDRPGRRRDLLLRGRHHRDSLAGADDHRLTGLQVAERHRPIVHHEDRVRPDADRLVGVQDHELRVRIHAEDATVGIDHGLGDRGGRDRERQRRDKKCHSLVHIPFLPFSSQTLKGASSLPGTGPGASEASGSAQA